MGQTDSQDDVSNWDASSSYCFKYVFQHHESGYRRENIPKCQFPDAAPSQIRVTDLTTTVGPKGQKPETPYEAYDFRAGPSTANEQSCDSRLLFASDYNTTPQNNTQQPREYYVITKLKEEAYEEVFPQFIHRQTMTMLRLLFVKESECMICMDRPRSVRFTCGHRVCCIPCAAQVACQCPYCKTTTQPSPDVVRALKTISRAGILDPSNPVEYVPPPPPPSRKRPMRTWTTTDYEEQSDSDSDSDPSQPAGGMRRRLARPSTHDQSGSSMETDANIPREHEETDEEPSSSAFIQSTTAPARNTDRRETTQMRRNIGPGPALTFTAAGGVTGSLSSSNQGGRVQQPSENR